MCVLRDNRAANTETNIITQNASVEACCTLNVESWLMALVSKRYRHYIGVCRAGEILRVFVLRRARVPRKQLI